MRRWTLVGGALCCIALSATACSSGGGGAGSKLTLLDKGTLTVCSNTAYEPFEFPKDNGFQGFDIELVDQVAKGLDLKVKVVSTPFDGIWTKPQAGACDLAVSAISITDERKQAARFSEPYFSTDQSLLVRSADESAYSSLDELDERTIGVEAGSTGEAYARANAPKGATVKTFDDPSKLVPALQAKEIDGVLQDQSVNQYWARKQSDGLAVAATFTTGESYGMAAATGNQQLIDAVDEQLDKAKGNGSYDRIYEAWFGKA